LVAPTTRKLIRGFITPCLSAEATKTCKHANADDVRRIDSICGRVVVTPGHIGTNSNNAHAHARPFG
jgi:hypothetical protein